MTPESRRRMLAMMARRSRERRAGIAPPERCATGKIMDAMTRRWGTIAGNGSSEWLLLWEVGDAAGFDARRRADAVMIGLWPSTRHEIHGVEIKASRSDWLRELADPDKWRAVGRHCDRFWLHALPGVCREGELPEAWGLRELAGKRWMTRRRAPKLEAEALTRQQLAALFLAARRGIEDARAKGRAEMAAEYLPRMLARGDR